MDGLCHGSAPFPHTCGPQRRLSRPPEWSPCSARLASPAVIVQGQTLAFSRTRGSSLPQASRPGSCKRLAFSCPCPTRLGSCKRQAFSCPMSPLPPPSADSMCADLWNQINPHAYTLDSHRGVSVDNRGVSPCSVNACVFLPCTRSAKRLRFPAAMAFITLQASRVRRPLGPLSHRPTATRTTPRSPSCTSYSLWAPGRSQSPPKTGWLQATL